MFKWITIFSLIWITIGGVSAYTSSYPQISKQIDLKTMSLKKPDYIIYKYDICNGTCMNYSSSSSYWGGSFWGK